MNTVRVTLFICALCMVAYARTLPAPRLNGCASALSPYPSHGMRMVTPPLPAPDADTDTQSPVRHKPRGTRVVHPPLPQTATNHTPLGLAVGVVCAVQSVAVAVLARVAVLAPRRALLGVKHAAHVDIDRGGPGPEHLDAQPAAQTRRGVVRHEGRGPDRAVAEGAVGV